MSCNHDRLKSVNCRIFCDICGAELPIDYLVGKSRIAEQKAAEPAKNAKESTTAEPKKRTARKAAK